MKNILISSGIILALSGSMLVAEEEPASPQDKKVQEAMLQHHSDIFDDPEFGTSSEVYK